MGSITLENGEREILKAKNVEQGAFDRKYNEEFILTNLNIICVRKGAFGKIKSLYKYPIRDISVDENGDAKIIFDGSAKSNGPKLQIYFRDMPYFFYFMDRQIANEWGNTISQMVTGRPMKNMTMEMISKAVNGIVNVIDQEVLHKPTAGKCNSCGAPISGQKGKVATCTFCGSQQVMQ